MNITRPVPIQQNLERIAALEAEATRITYGPGGRCFVMPDGRLLTIHNEQLAGSPIFHAMAVMPLLREDAEDFYGYTEVRA